MELIMKKIKIILSTLAVTAMLVGLFMLLATSASAAIPGYGIFVGGIEITENNASDVLGDGTVSYDADTNTLTLNNATITDYYTFEYYDWPGFCGIYNDTQGFKINLVGDNKIVTVIKGEQEDDTANAIFSTQAIEIMGQGKLSITCWAAVTCMNAVSIKDCEISCSWGGITSMVGGITLDGAKVNAKVGIAMTPSGDITIKNTTINSVLAAGEGLAIYTEGGSVTVDDSNVTVLDGSAIVIGEGGGTLTVKNTVLDLTGLKECTVMVPVGKGIFEGVSGRITATGEVAYGMIFGSTVEMKDCDLTFSCIGQEEGAGAITSMGDIMIKDSKLKIEARSSGEAAVCIGGLEAPGANVTIENSELDLVSGGYNAIGIYSNSVRLTGCTTKIEVTADPMSDGLGLGIGASQGVVIVGGGVLDVTATGPAENAEKVTCCIMMGNQIITPQFINADIKLRGNTVLNAYPDLTLYTREHGIFASPDFSGATVDELTNENYGTLKFLHIYPLFKVTIDGNGGEGEMLETESFYGEYTLPENGFTPPEGKLFKGWATSLDGEIIEEGAVYMLRDDVTFYAIWEDIEKEPENSTPEGTDPIDPDHTHSYSTEWKHNEKGHYKDCECGAIQYEGSHVDSNENGSCDICGLKLAEDGLGAGAIVAIVIGSVAVVGGGGFAILRVVSKTGEINKKDKKKSN